MIKAAILCIRYCKHIYVKKFIDNKHISGIYLVKNGTFITDLGFQVYLM